MGSVTSELDLVLAMGAQARWPLGRVLGEFVWWGQGRRLGVFLQNRARPGLVYGLPSSNHELLEKARPDRNEQYGYGQAEFAERIGPWQLEGDHLWFGKTFYDGEGITGVGGLGYFDTSAKQYRIFTSPVMSAWSVPAIHVQSDTVWLALAHRGEWGDPGGGVVRFDQTTDGRLRVAAAER